MTPQVQSEIYAAPIQFDYECVRQLEEAAVHRADTGVTSAKVDYSG